MSSLRPNRPNILPAVTPPSNERSDSVIIELKQLNKNIEGIKVLIDAIGSEQNNSVGKAFQKIVDQTDKQKRIMNRIRLYIEKSLTDPSTDTTKMQALDQSPPKHSRVPPIAMNPHRQSIQVTDEHELYESKRQGMVQNHDTLVQLVDEHKKLVREQNSMLQQIKLLLSTLHESPVKSDNKVTIMNQAKLSVQDIHEDHQTGANTERERMKTAMPGKRAKPSPQVLELKEILNNKKIDMKRVEAWIGQLFHTISAKAFEKYCNGGDEEQMKLDFAEYILKNYRKYIQMVTMVHDKKTREKLLNTFEETSKKTINFLLCKYPQARKKIADISLSSKIEDVNIMLKPQLDILHNCEIPLQVTSSGDELNRKIKSMLNQLILNTNKAYDSYKKFMLEKLFDPEEKLDKTETFTYLIGRKIRDSTPPYTEMELNTPGFFVKSNQMLRIVIKWIEELIGWFNSPERTLENQYGFLSEEGYALRLSVDQRQTLWECFSSKQPQLRDRLKKLQGVLRKTIENVVNVSDNDITAGGKEDVSYLNREEIIIPVVCSYIAKSMESYTSSIINNLFQLFSEVLDEIDEELTSVGETFKIISFTVGDLLRCKCTGKKERVLGVYERLKQLEAEGEVQIIKTKNRLTGPTQDILINYKCPNISGLICQIQLALSGSNEEHNDHFNHFLYEQGRSRHGVICELAMLVDTWDPRRNYLKKQKLSFKSQNPPFSYKQTEDKNSSSIICTKDNKTLDFKEGDSTVPYICNQCCRFVDAYRNIFDPQYCHECNLVICPYCYLRLQPSDKSLAFLLDGFPRLDGYFQTALPAFIEEKSSVLNEKLIELLKVHRYMLVVSYKNNQKSTDIDLIKIYDEETGESGDEEEDDEEEEEQSEQKEEKNQQGSKKKAPKIVKSFSYEPFDVSELENSLVIILKPTSKPITMSGEELKKQRYHKKDVDADVVFEQMYDLNQEFEFEENQDDSVRVLVNTKTKKKLVINYLYTSEEADVWMSAYTMDKLIREENKQKRGRIVFSELAIDFKKLQQLQKPDNIKMLEISQCYVYNGEEEQINNSFQALNIFSKLEGFCVSDFDEYSKHLPYIFNNNLKELCIQCCNIRNFENIPAKSQSLKLLDLSDNQLQGAVPQLQLPSLLSLDLSCNKLTDISALSTSKLDKLDKLSLFVNKIKGELPVLKLPKLRALKANDNAITGISRLKNCELPSLKICQLSSNQIKGVLPNLKCFPKLEQFAISKNKLEGLEAQQNNSLMILDLSCNNIKGALPVMELDKLQILVLKSNKIINMDELKKSSFKSLRILEVYDNTLEGAFPLVMLDELEILRIEPEKINFKITPNDYEADQQLTCDQCGAYMVVQEVFDYLVGDNQVVCRNCNSGHKKNAIQIANIKGTTLLKYA